MNNENKLEEYLTGLGAIAETAGIMRDNLIKNGFTREEACLMVSKFISDLINGKKD